MKRSAFSALIQLQIVEEIVDDLPIVEADFRELATVDLDDLVDVAHDARVTVVHFRIIRVAGRRLRGRLDAPQRGVVPMHGVSFPHMIISYRGKTPKVHPTAFIAPTAVLIGDVEIGEESSIWFGAVLRGDNGPIRIGARTSIQDNAVIHVTHLTKIDDDVTVGHAAVMEDCHVKSHALIGSNAVLLNGSIIGEGSLVAAGSVVGENIEIPDHVLAAGAPAKVKKPIEGPAQNWIEIAAEEYVLLSRSYMEEGIDAART